MELSIILHSPEHPGNVGAIARIMANFDCPRLLLIDPQCDHLCTEARNRAKHAQHVLESAKIIAPHELKTFDVIVATSGLLGGEYNIARIPFTPEKLRAELDDKTGSVAILFGRESSGLSNVELELADFLVHIPTAKEYPVVNLSQSVAILLYELSKISASTPSVDLANKEQKKIIFSLIEEKLATMSFTTEEKKDTQRILWKHIVGKSLLTGREAQALIGFLKKV